MPRTKHRRRDISQTDSESNDSSDEHSADSVTSAGQIPGSFDVSDYSYDEQRLPRNKRKKKSKKKRGKPKRREVISSASSNSERPINQSGQLSARSPAEQSNNRQSNDSSSDASDGSDVRSRSAQSGISNVQSDSIEGKEARLSRALAELRVLENKGYETIRTFGASSRVKDVEEEVKRLRTQRKKDIWVKRLDKMTIGAAGLLSKAKFLQHQFGLNFQGFGKAIALNIDDFADIHEELYEKYSEFLDYGPEIQWLMTFTTAAVAYSESKKATARSHNGADVDRILATRPELRRKFEEAAMEENAANARTSTPGGGLGSMLGSAALSSMTSMMNQRRNHPSPPASKPVTSRITHQDMSHAVPSDDDVLARPADVDQLLGGLAENELDVSEADNLADL